MPPVSWSATSRTPEFDAGADQVRRERLERAIEGKGAIYRFRDLVHGETLGEQWYAFSTDRQMGRARAANGIRVG